MNSSCAKQQPHAVTRDDTILPDAVQHERGETKTPLESALVDSPSQLQSAAIPIPPAHEQHAPAAATMRSDDAIQATMRNIEIVDPPIHSDGIVDPNIVQTDKNKYITDVSFPVISSADYETDAEFSCMFLYLHNGTLSGNVKKDKPIFIMEDRYTINEDGLLYSTSKEFG